MAKDIADLLEDFIGSGYASAELFSDGLYHNNNDMRNAFSAHCKRNMVPVKVLMVNGKVYLKRL